MGLPLMGIGEMIGSKDSEKRHGRTEIGTKEEYLMGNRKGEASSIVPRPTRQSVGIK